MANITINSLPTASTIDATNDILPIYTSSSAATQGINRNTFLNLSSAPVGLTDIQTLTNKTLTSPTINGATLSGTISGTYTLGGTPTFPSTVVSTAGVQTLTNKTLTSPTINSPTITNATLTTDTVTGYTVSNSGTVYGIPITTGVINTAGTINGASLVASSVATAAIADGAITPAKLQAGTASSWTWQSWTPTWSGLTIGNATVNCQYAQIGKTVIAKVNVTLGSTSSVSAVTTLTLPVTAVAPLNGDPCGTFNFSVAAIVYQGYGQVFSTTQLRLVAFVASGSYLTQSGFSATTPNTWAAGSIINGYFTYQAA